MDNHTLDKRLSIVEHQIEGNGSIGMKEQLSQLRIEVEKIKISMNLIRRAIWLANGALLAGMLAMNFLR